MDKNLTWFLSGIAKDPKLSAAFDSYNLDPIYEDIVRYAGNNYRANRVRQFTDFIIDLGINPLECVTCVHDYMYCKSDITDIVIPDRDCVSYIGNYAFMSCRRLSSVIIDMDIDTIYVGAFKDCVTLSTIEIPEGVTKIGSYAFQIKIANHRIILDFQVV